MFVFVLHTKKLYCNQAHIEYIESQTDQSNLTQDSLHHLISTYTFFKKKSDFLESGYVCAINNLNTSAFYQLSEKKLIP